MQNTASAKGPRLTVGCRGWARPSVKRCKPAVVSFMRSDDAEASSKEARVHPFDMMVSSGSLDVQGAMSTATQRAKDGLGWLRHAFQDPEDFSASAIGRMVSKEYGRHELPHTEQHRWRSSPAASPVSSPKATAAAAAPGKMHTTTTTTTTQQQQQQQQQQHPPERGWGWGEWNSHASSDSEAYHSPPSGPGFLLQQQKRQE